MIRLFDPPINFQIFTCLNFTLIHLKIIKKSILIQFRIGIISTLLKWIKVDFSFAIKTIFDEKFSNGSKWPSRPAKSKAFTWLALRTKVDQNTYSVLPWHIFKSSSDYKKQTDQLQAELESIRRDRDKKTSKIQVQSKEISELRFENEKLRSLLTKSECQVTKVYLGYFES